MDQQFFPKKSNWTTNVSLQVSAMLYIQKDKHANQKTNLKSHNGASAVQADFIASKFCMQEVPRHIPYDIFSDESA
jgi:hypothetical protein